VALADLDCALATMPHPRFFRLPPDKRARILEAAALEFASAGFRGASLNRIIRAAGISKGAAYYYFDDKADLFAAVVRHGWDALTPSRPIDVVSLTGETFWPVVLECYREMLERAQTQPWLMAVGKLVYGPLPSREISDLVRDEFARVRQWLAALVARGQAVGALRSDVPGDLLMTMLVAMLESADRWMVSRAPSLVPADTDRLGGVIFDMIQHLVEPAEVRP
jgi:AcrR family transcriptional regulator